MKKMKRFFAAALALAMALGMSMTAFAATSTNQNPDMIPRPSDRVEVKVTGVESGATVTLYQIAKADYQDNNIGLKEYTVVNAQVTNPATGEKETLELADLVGSRNPDGTVSADGPTSAVITEIANGLKDGSIEPIKDGAEDARVETLGEGVTEAKFEVPAGVYVAIITGGKRVYNPILLTAAYTPAGADGVDAGALVGGEINTGDHYLWGATAVAKSTAPTITKEMDGTKTDDEDSTKETASIGDKIDFTLNPTVPSYPVEAVNKTFFISDTMTKGLAFDYTTLAVKIEGQNIIRRTSGTYEEFVLAEENGTPLKDADGNDKVIAKAIQEGNGFNLAFVYNNLVIPGASGNQAYTYVPVVTYSAVVTNEAAIGQDPNTNTVTLYYANQPNSGNSYETPDDKPDPDQDETISKTEDEKSLYTYRLAFLKNDEDGKALAGAVFGVYKYDPTTETLGDLVDVVITNESGYGETVNVRSGEYAVKELAAPAGYSLNDKVYPITANWTTATTTVEGTVTRTAYTSVKDDSLDGVQVGWLKAGTFYAMDEYAWENEDGTGRIGLWSEEEDGTKVFEEVTGVQAAYIAQHEETSTTMTETVENPDVVGGVSLCDTTIPNTKLSSLPSTGGMGTMIFTVGGCLIMIVAAGMYFSGRKKNAAK